MRKALVAVASAVLSLSLLSSAYGQALRKTPVTIPVPVMTFYPLYVGVEKGYFTKQGLDVEIIQTSGDGPDVDALISGSVDFTVSTPNRLMTAFEQGKPLIGVMNLGNRMVIDCFMNKATAEKLGINVKTPLEQRIKALKGLTVAGTRPGAFTYLLLIGYAKRFGLVPQQDLRIIGIGGPGAMIPAVENNQVQVACIGAPAQQVAVARGKSVMFTDNVGGADPQYDNFLFELLYVRPDFAKSSPDVVRRMVRGFLDAIAFIHDGPDAEHAKILKKHFSGASEEVLLAAMKEQRPMFVRDGRITKEAVDKAANFLIQTGALKKAPEWTAITTNEFLPK